MRTAKEKAIEFVRRYHSGEKCLTHYVEELIKEQDQDTRHACAEAVLMIPEELDSSCNRMVISSDKAHLACMNTKGFGDEQDKC